MIIAIFCCACISGLVLSAFDADPKADSVIDCYSGPAAVASETWQALLTFAMGWLCTMIAKHRRDLSRQVLKIAQCCQESLSSVVAGVLLAYSKSVTAFSYLIGLRRRYLRLEQPLWLSKGVLGIFAIMMLCGLCVIGLLVSAFNAVPGAEPPRDGVASESSTVVRIFTASWIFILSLKLLHELVGLVGYSCLFQPW